MAVILSVVLLYTQFFQLSWHPFFHFMTQRFAEGTLRVNLHGLTLFQLRFREELWVSYYKLWEITNFEFNRNERIQQNKKGGWKELNIRYKCSYFAVFLHDTFLEKVFANFFLLLMTTQLAKRPQWSDSQTLRFSCADRGHVPVVGPQLSTQRKALCGLVWPQL